MEVKRLNTDKLEHRTTISLSDNQRDAILSIRQRDEYRECSLSEIVRMLINEGLNSVGYASQYFDARKEI